MRSQQQMTLPRPDYSRMFLRKNIVIIQWKLQYHYRMALHNKKWYCWCWWHVTKRQVRFILIVTVSLFRNKCVYLAEWRRAWSASWSTVKCHGSINQLLSSFFCLVCIILCRSLCFLDGSRLFMLVRFWTVFASTFASSMGIFVASRTEPRVCN